MWCSTCHQDVPAVSHPVSRRKICSRCQHPNATKPAVDAARICDDGIALDEPAAAVVAAAPPFHGDDWSIRQRMRNLSRELRRPASAATSGLNPLPDGRRRFDPPHNLLDEIERITAPGAASITPQPTAAALQRSRRSEGRQVIAWLVVAAGAISLSAGIVWIAWSLGTEQMHHWNRALGLTLGGQGALILGLVLVVSRLWRSSRFSAGKLQDVHARLGQLQHTADALTAMRSGGAPAFYAELVRGASPQTLLANLKGQVDQLATRLGSGR